MEGNIISFLKEYEQLCKKYKMGIQGCGCCGSPYLIYYKDNQIQYINDVLYDDDLDKITIEDKDLEEYIKDDLIKKLF